MKHLSSSSDSLISFISMSSSSSPTDEMHYFIDDIQAMLDEDDQNEINNIHPKICKKRRLTQVQVKALEKHFEIDYRLEPDRKVKLSIELGLDPRQVAVWFQNRRARCKNKQLEKEYEVLKSCYEELKQSYENVVCQKEALNAELRDLKLKLAEASESDNQNNIVNNADHETMVDHMGHRTWSCSSSSLTQLDGSSILYPPEDLSWFQCGVNGAAGGEGGSTGPIWFNFEVNY